MHSRCENPDDDSYHLYGAMGIRVHPRWCGDDGFVNFCDDMGPRPYGHTLDRLDSNEDYAPGRCKWSDATAQNRNKSTCRFFRFKGQVKCMTEWSEELFGRKTIIQKRLYRGWTLTQAFHIPPQSLKDKRHDPSVLCPMGAETPVELRPTRPL